MCRISYSFSCHYFIHDKKNCQCKIYAVNQEALLYKYDDDSRKIGGLDKPDLSLCPSFQQNEDFCSVSSVQCLIVCILIYIIISMQCQITSLDIVFLIFNWNQNFREGRCRYSGSLLEHLDHIVSPENCQHACKLLKTCKYFNYDKILKDCELLGSANRNCDLIRGPPHPSFEDCWENEHILWQY